MQLPATVPALLKALAIKEEHAMVRHECAEALGSIATPEVLPILKEYRESCEERVVRESCEVALDMYDWENDPNSLHLVPLEEKA
jgi:deoxyhypusine monooxygenase